MILDRRSSVPPLVSIIVVTYNQAPYLRQTLESVAAQQFIDFEVIVIDDASNDGSICEIVDCLDIHGLSALLLQNYTNRGLVETLSTALKHVRTTLVSMVAGDDLLAPEKLRVQVPLLVDAPNRVGFVYSDAHLITQDGEHLTESWLERFAPYAEIGDGDLFERFLSGHLHVPALTLLMRTNILRECRPFGSGLHYEDVDLNLRLSYHSLARFSTFISATYRLNPAGLRETVTVPGTAQYQTQLITYRPWTSRPQATRRIAQRRCIMAVYGLYEHGALRPLQVLRYALEIKSTPGFAVLLLALIKVPMRLVLSLECGRRSLGNVIWKRRAARIGRGRQER